MAISLIRKEDEAVSNDDFREMEKKARKVDRIISICLTVYYSILLIVIMCK